MAAPQVQLTHVPSHDFRSLEPVSVQLPSSALSLTILALLGASMIALLALHIVAPDQELRQLAPALVILISSVAAYFLWVGRLLAAKLVLAYGIWSVATVIAAFTGGVRAPVVIGYPMIILMAAWVVGPRAALYIAALTVLATVGLMIAEYLGLLQATLPSTLAIHAGDQIVIYAISVVLAVLLVRTYQSRLDELGKLSIDLQVRTTDLEVAKTELNQAQEVAEVGSWVYDFATDTVWMSAETCRIYRFQAEETVSFSQYFAGLHPDDRVNVDQAWHRALTEKVFDLEHRILCGEGIRWLRQRAEFKLNSQGIAVTAIGIAQDITERKAVEIALQESEERYRKAFRISPDAVNINRLSDGLYYDINDSFTRLMGWTRMEVIGKTSGEIHVWKRTADRQRLVEAIERDGVCENLEAEFVAKDGHILTALMSAHVMTLGGTPCVLTVTRDITRRKLAEKTANDLAFCDPLTHLPNRKLLLDRLAQAIAAASRHQHKNALLFIDLDDFKTLNESLGHEQGDLLLQMVAKSVMACVREGDTVARFGSDEFVVILEDLSESSQIAASQAEAVGGKIIASLNRTYELTNFKHHSSASVGVTMFGEKEGVDEPVKRAELAMFQAKASGRNTLRFFDPKMQAAVSARADMEMGLREAVTRGQFVVHYQPQVKWPGHITGVEGLVRWENPLRGMVSPSEFIQLAEDTGLILPLGSWVLETACNQLAMWSTQQDMAHLTIAVNVSAKQFHQANFVGQVLTTLERTGANPKSLKLELTESLLVSNVEDVIAKMMELKGIGVGFSLDDFGTGYSSLSYLKRLPLDQVKIDQGFVREILSNSNDAAIAKMVIALSDTLGLTVIAEGVETQAQCDFLAELGCHAYQGYFFGKPMPVEALEKLFAA